MKRVQPKVLIVAPSRKTRGGITAVVSCYEQCAMWKTWCCYWIETHTDRGFIFKILICFKALGEYFVRLPSSKLVHIHTSEPFSLVRKLLFFFPAFWLKKKIIVHFHSFSPETTIHGRFRFLYYFVFRNCSKLIVLSNYWKNEIGDAFGNELNISILNNPSVIIKNNATGESDKATEKNYILFAGTLNQRKGFLDLIEAFGLIFRKHPSWKIVFAGNGDIERGEEAAKNLGMTSQVEFWGWVSGAEKEYLFSNASIFCLPSHAEGFPMAILDAIAYGIPIITTPVGSIPEYFKNDNNCLIVEVGDTINLALQLDKAIHDEKLRKKLSNASLQLAERFAPETIIAELIEIYDEVCNSA